MATQTDITSVRQGAALDPLTHFTLIPILFTNLGVAIYLYYRATDQRLLHLWLIVMAVAFMLLNLKTRLYAARLQDRLIRMEERQRLAMLLPHDELVASHKLTVPQLVGLRFACDEELPALVRRTLAEGLTQKQIKDSIQVWRPDYIRV